MVSIHSINHVNHINTCFKRPRLHVEYCQSFLFCPYCWFQTSLPLAALPLCRVIIACCFRVAALSGNAALALSPSGIAPELNRIQLSAICRGGQSGKVIDLLAWRCLPLGHPSAASGACAVEQISSSKRQCGKRQVSLKPTYHWRILYSDSLNALSQSRIIHQVTLQNNMKRGFHKCGLQQQTNIKGWTKCLMTQNWQKWKSTFLTCPCYKIYRVEAKIGFSRKCFLKEQRPIAFSSQNYRLK